MRNFTILLLLLGWFNFSADAQQDPMYTKYMFNSLAYNPGFAGSPDYMSIRVLHRTQWWGIEGAPSTQAFTIHSPWKEKVGLGLSVVNDKIGGTGSTSAYLVYAYRVNFGPGKLAMGLQAGMMNWRANWSNLRYRDPRALDEVFDDNTNLFLPNFGAGIFFHSQKFYAGFSVPHLISSNLRKDMSSDVVKWAKLYRHYFFTAGGAFPINGRSLYFKPSILIKSVGLFGNFSAASNSLTRVGAPTEFDVDMSLLFNEVLWIGVSFRAAFEAEQFGGSSSFDSVDIWTSYYLANGLRIGLSYDYTITELQRFTDASFEIMLGYDFNYNAKKLLTPRYF